MAADSITEKWEYNTLILTSYDGHEQRIKNRQYPRHFLTYDYPAMDCLEAQWLRGLGRLRQDKTYYIPMWHTPIYFTSDFTGSTGMYVEKSCIYSMENVQYIEVFFEDDANQVTNTARKVNYISEDNIGVTKIIDATLNKNKAWIFPLRRCSIQPMQGLNYIYSDGTNVSVSFEDMLDIVYTPNIPESVKSNYETFDGWNKWNLPEKYRGKNMFLHLPQWVDDDSVSLSLTKNTERLDNEIGVFKYDMMNTMSYDVHSVKYMLRRREEINNMTRFFKRVEGQYKSFYAPTMVNDIRCTTDIISGATEILADWVKMEEFYKTNSRTRRIVIFTKDWQSYIYQILTYGKKTVNNVDYARLLLTSPITTTILANNILMISFLNLVRLDEDELQLNYETDQVANTQLVFREVDDLEG